MYKRWLITQDKRSFSQTYEREPLDEPDHEQNKGKQSLKSKIPDRKTTKIQGIYPKKDQICKLSQLIPTPSSADQAVSREKP